ncbi:MAG: prepilin-type N-terminal cleavage/methylation domain-containing protein [Gammaproteobacteria bacterium]|nr:prepilin-type N-terminal cleavage/methylation domain-containing protein [Gammaproteobacteria bacterium]
MKKQQTGFTLIEIAIVLVIIGLLLGGVLKGQEMMNNAEIKRTVNDYNGIGAAIYSYLDRYGALPGDDPNAVARWGGTAPAGGTPGDGVIEGAWNSVTATDESRLVWEHLRFAGLVNGAGNTSPLNPFGGVIGVEDAQAGGTTAIASGTVVCMDRVEGKDAEILDIQMDDGNGTTGDMMNAAASAYDNTTLNTAFTICRQI